MRRVAAALIFFTAACSLSSDASDEPTGGPTWVDAWQAAPSGVIPIRCSGPQPVAAFAGNQARSQTIRMILRPTVEGAAVRVRLSNRLSETPLRVSHVTVGEYASGSAVAKGTIRDVLFNTARGTTIAAGDDVTSDPLVVGVEPNRQIAVSIAIASGGPLTWHADGPTSYVTAPGTGDLTGAPSTSKFSTRLVGIPVVTGLEVRVRRPTTAIAAIGDSFTDAGNRGPEDHWLTILADRLDRSGDTKAVLNGGITCNRLLRTTAGGGPAALDRFSSDVLTRPGLSHVVILEGANDLAGGATADMLIAAITDLATRARAGNVKVIGGTLWPRNAASPSERSQRLALNRWIRTTDVLDGYLDFDRVIRDPANSDRINPRYNADGLHVNSRGMRAMGRAINLSLFS